METLAHHLLVGGALHKGDVRQDPDCSTLLGVAFMTETDRDGLLEINSGNSVLLLAAQSERTGGVEVPRPAEPGAGVNGLSAEVEQRRETSITELLRSASRRFSSAWIRRIC